MTGMRHAGRRGAPCAPALLVVALLGGCATTGVTQPAPTATVTVTVTPQREDSRCDSPSSSGSGSPKGAIPSSDELATTLLARLPVGTADSTCYRREAFGERWTDATSAQGSRNGCDTRNDVLRRDLTAAKLKAGTGGCVVLSGELADPYSGRQVMFTRGVATSAAVQLDHVVSIQNAWASGARTWPGPALATFANDPLNLLTVSGEANVSKGGRDAASWLPESITSRCEYVARQIAVKSRWALTVTTEERAAMTKVLRTCPGQRVLGATWQVPKRGEVR